ncbi:hypothetical protein HK405_007775 [Cladochytrium tenue]|nr:hypothetical protein HK405_007775 [Cladochytrium tenue]
MISQLRSKITSASVGGGAARVVSRGVFSRRFSVSSRFLPFPSAVAATYAVQYGNMSGHGTRRTTHTGSSSSNSKIPTAMGYSSRY